MMSSSPKGSGRLIPTKNAVQSNTSKGGAKKQLDRYLRLTAQQIPSVKLPTQCGTYAGLTGYRGTNTRTE